MFQLITRFSDRGYNMSCDDVALAVQDVVQALPIARQNKFPFVNGKPGNIFTALSAATH